MSNDLASFYDEMVKAGEKADGSSASLGMVGKVLVQFGFHYYSKGQSDDFWHFWTETKTPDETDTKAAQLNTKIKEAGHTGNARFGIRVTVFKDVLTQEKPYKKDVSEFTAKWQREGFNLIYDTLRANSIPASEVFFGQVQAKPNPYHVALGDDGKIDKDQNGNPKYPTVRVPVRKFASEAEARNFVNGLQGPSLPPFSETALKTFEGNVESLTSQAEEIRKWLAKAKDGQPFGDDSKSFPLPKPLNPATAKKYIAEIYGIEPDDIDLLGESPF